MKRRLTSGKRCALYKLHETREESEPEKNPWLVLLEKSALKLYLSWRKSRGTMLVNGKILNFCGAKHCILSVHVNSSACAYPASDLTFDQDRKSTILNDGELRTNSSEVKGKINRQLLHR